ncbi:hypothetical protein [Anaerotignum sp.]
MEVQTMMPWMASIIVAGISGLFSYLGVTNASKSAHDATILEIQSEQEKQSLIIDEKISGLKDDIKRLEDKQDKHNEVIERTFKLEQKVEDIEKQIK